MKTIRLLPFVVLPLTGCTASPSLPLFGAYFPAWLLCATGGLVCALVVRAALISLRLDGRVGPLVLVYPLVAAIFTCIFWIAFFRN